MAEAADTTDPIEAFERKFLLEVTKAENVRAGQLGAAMGGTSADAGGRGAALGNRFWAKRWVLERDTAELDTHVAPDAVLDAAHTVITTLGTIVTDHPPLHQTEIWALTRCGMGNLLIALVRVSAVPATNGGSHVTIRGASYESPVKFLRPHAARKAAAKVRAALVESLSA